MKNKKKLLLGILPVLLLGLAGASLGTVAWFEATRNIIAGDSEKELDVEPSAVTLGDIKLYLDPPSSTLPAVELSDSEGNRWAVIKGVDYKYYYQSVPSTSYEGTYGTISLTARAMKIVDGSETPASAGDLKPFEGKEVVFDVYGNNRTRVSLTAPSTSNITVYSNAPGSETILHITLKIESVDTTTGTVTYSYNTQSSVSVYYSVSGGTTTPEEGAECPLGEVDTATSGVGHVYIGTYKEPIDPTEGFGMYPQSRVTDATVLEALEGMETENSRGYLEYNNKEYKRLSGNPYLSTYTFDDGNPIVKDTIYYFEVEPIKWKVISNGNNEAFLTSVLVLDNHRYNPSSNVYESSEIRTWLNSEFYNNAFTTNEQEAINVSEVDNSPASTQEDPNQYARSTPTYDKVFLLSNLELFGNTNIFPTDASRICKTSEYARAKGVNSTNNNAWYYTRSPCAGGSSGAWIVHPDGSADGRSVYYVYGGVRPALRLPLK